MPYSTNEHNNPVTAQNSVISPPAVESPNVESPAVQSSGVQSNNYQNELQQQRLRRLATELAAITDPSKKLQFIEQRLLDNLQQLKRQLAILQQEIAPTAKSDKQNPGV